MEKNYSLEEKINIIYNFLYNENNKNCFSVGSITLGHISMNDIKISFPDDNEMEYYDKNKSDILNGKLKLIYFDEDTFQLIFKKYSDQLSVNIKVNFYHDEIASFVSPVNNDSLFSYILSTLVLNNKTKHILLPIINLDIKFSDIEKYIIDDICHSQIKTAIKNNKISENCCLQVREHLFKSMNLKDYLSENTCTYKILLFQLIHTLAVIEKDFRGFKHNNLLIKNILIYLKKKSDTYTEYEFNDTKYYLPNSDFDIKITNFESSFIPKHYGKEKKCNDILFFLKDLQLIDTKNNCNKETVSFINRIKENTGIIDLLNDEYFSEYLVKPSNNKETFSNNNYFTGSIKTFMDSDNFSNLGDQELISKSNIMIHTREIKNNTQVTKTQVSKNHTQVTESHRRVIKKQDGGSKPELAPYRGEKNNPYTSNDQKKINEKRYHENPVKEPPVLLEQKIYDTTQKSQPKPQIPPAYIPLYSGEGEIANRLLPYSSVLNQPPIQKVYNVSLTNPLVGHTTLNKIYEDVLPGDPRDFTAKTIYERKQLIDFLRNSMIENCDGEEISAVGGKSSLLSYIKIMDINPYAVNMNPYMNLPRNFLLYRAGYPVRLDQKTMKHIGLAKSSMGVNIRMYMLSLGDLRCKTINKLINADNFDVWRDLKYYDWIRDEIIKRKVSPNFIAPILYKIDTESNIEWEKLELIKLKGTIADDLNMLKENQQKINDKHNIPRIYQKLLPKYFRDDLDKKELEKIKRQLEREDISINSNKTLILLTEAPTSSLHQWSSMIYSSSGVQKKMSSSGYHAPEVWISVLFQLVYAFSVLQIRGIYINNFSLENNVYVKDIFTDPNAVGSWIYRVNNIDFYIPNYGYILLIDSKYADIDVSDKGEKQKYKIYGEIYQENSDFDMKKIRESILGQFKSLINPDNFGYIFKVKGGSILDESIINFLKKMHDDTITDIKDYLIKYFGEFLHNRIGTLLYKSERENINMLSKPNFTKGNLIIYKKRYEEYEWAIYVDSVNYLKKKIIIKDGNEYKLTEVFSSSLYGYPENETILPETKNNMRYDTSYIYETYNLNNLEK